MFVANCRRKRVASLAEHLERTNGPLLVELQKPHGASLGISLKG